MTAKHVALFVIVCALIAAVFASPFLQTRIKGTSNEQTTLLATGDIMLGRSVHTATIRSGDPFYPFRNTKELLSSADMTLVNLENPLVDPCPPTDSGMKFCAPTIRAMILHAVGIDIANIANNHSKNYGVEGYQSTHDALSRASIASIDGDKTAVLTRNGVKFGFIGFDLVTNAIADEVLTQKISALRAKSDIVTVSVHWGVEYSPTPTQEQRRIARFLVDAGASLIIGTHPHVVQTMEIYRGAPILYSFGNFVFDQMWSQETREGIVGTFVFSGKTLKSYEFTPIAIDHVGQPEIVTDSVRSQRILSRLQVVQ